MNAQDMLRYLRRQGEQIELLNQQLDEIQVAFNAQFDDFQTRHDAQLDRLTQEVFQRLNGEGSGTVAPGLVTAIEAQLPAERERIDERRAKLRDEYLPQRREAADGTLQQAQLGMKHLRALNPALDREEEKLKAQKAELEAQLAALNDQIRSQSRGLRLVRHFAAILRADRERQRIVGKLEALAQSLYDVRRRWSKRATASARSNRRSRIAGSWRALPWPGCKPSWTNWTTRRFARTWPNGGPSATCSMASRCPCRAPTLSWRPAWPR
ncbi:MAG: hypothetical protein P8129_11180 [Anaerolineae bacterium]